MRVRSVWFVPIGRSGLRVPPHGASLPGARGWSDAGELWCWYWLVVGGSPLCHGAFAVRCGCFSQKNSPPWWLVREGYAQLKVSSPGVTVNGWVCVIVSKERQFFAIKPRRHACRECLPESTVFVPDRLRGRWPLARCRNRHGNRCNGGLSHQRNDISRSICCSPFMPMCFL